MILKRLFRKAPQPASPRPEMLARAALDTTNAAAQREACRGIRDLAILRQAADTTTDAGTRDLAIARRRHLMCSFDEGSSELPQAFEELAQTDDLEEIAQIALEAKAPQLRRAAIKLLPQDAEVLARCAAEDALSAHRQLAVERIDGRATLEQVIRHIGKKDTKVYRFARDKLRKLIEQQERPRQAQHRCAELCGQLEQLGRHHNWAQDRARLTLIDRQWAEIAEDLDAIGRDRYQQLRATFLAAHERHTRAAAEPDADRAAARQTRTAAITRKRALVERLERLEHEQNADRLVNELASIGAGWSACDTDCDDKSSSIAAAPDGEPTPTQPLDSELAELHKAGQEALDRALARQQRLTDPEHQRELKSQLFAEIEALLETSDSIDQTTARSLQQRMAPFIGADSTHADGDAAALQIRDAGTEDDQAALALLNRLQRRVQKQQRHAQRKLAAAPEQIESLARHLEAGELRKAEPLMQRISATLDQARAAGLPRSDINQIDKQLKRYQGPLRDLQRWRRWSSDQNREGLCHQADQLAAAAAQTEDTDLEALAARLNHLKRDWRRIDQSGTPASDTYWKRFKQATEQVANRCEPFFQARAERLQASQAARRTLCEKLEHFLSAVDWDSVDWKAMVRAEREMRHAWNALHPLDAGGRGALEGRFRRGIARVDKALRDERERNQTHKKELIHKMQSLVEFEPLESAIHDAKALQQQWHTTVAGRQQEENALWRQFRTATDAVFARRQHQRAARDQELETHLEQCQTLCAQAEQLSRNQIGIDQLAASWKTLAAHWADALALPLPRPAKKRLEQRWNAAEQRIEEQLQAMRDDADWRELEHIKRHADCLNSTARNVLAGMSMPSEEQLRRDWQALSQTDGNLAEQHGKTSVITRQLERSLETLLASAHDGAAQPTLTTQLETNRRLREDICLRLEICAHLDSPAELETRRMALQVERLQEKLRDGEAEPVTETKRLLTDWFLATPAAQDPSLDRRFEQILTTLMPAQRSVSDSDSGNGAD